MAEWICTYASHENPVSSAAAKLSIVNVGYVMTFGYAVQAAECLVEREESLSMSRIGFSHTPLPVAVAHRWPCVTAMQRA